ncbi:LytR C-terminal domain-containing protein [Catenulispora yoronensis]
MKANILVENGTTADGRSKQLAETLRADGFKNASGVGYSSSDVTVTEVYYSDDKYEASAQAVADALQLPAGSVRPGGDGSAPVVVRVGADFASGDVFNRAAPTTPSALPTAAASSADVESAGDKGLCVAAAH